MYARNFTRRKIRGGPRAAPKRAPPRRPQVRIELGWGAQPLVVDLSDIPGGDAAVVLGPPASPPPRSYAEVVAEALAAPVGSAPLAERLVGCARICVLVPDRTRKDVAGGVLPHLLPTLRAAGVAVDVGVATGKHPPDLETAAAVGGWSHDARSPALVEVGRTPHGTPVAFPRAVLDADLRVLIGELRPHYFAGYAGGAKLLFPGVAGEAGIWHNHRLKAAPGARLGSVDGNPCRADFEAAAALAGPSFSLNVVRGEHGAPVFAVAGDPVAAHRAGVARAAAVFERSRPAGAPFDTVLVSDAHPVSLNLYQACKLLAPAGAVLADGGTVVVAAACTDGIGPVETINEAIYRLGLMHSLPPRHRVVLVSLRPEASVRPTFAAWAPDVPTALRAAGPGRLCVLPRAGDLVIRG